MEKTNDQGANRRCRCPNCNRFVPLSAPTCISCKNRYHKFCTGNLYPIMPDDWTCKLCSSNEDNETDIHEIHLAEASTQRKSFLINTPGDSLMVINEGDEVVNSCKTTLNDISLTMIDDDDILSQQVCKIIDRKLQLLRDEILKEIKNILHENTRKTINHLRQEERISTNQILNELNDNDDELIRLRKEITTLQCKLKLLEEENKELTLNLKNALEGSNEHKTKGSGSDPEIHIAVEYYKQTQDIHDKSTEKRQNATKKLIILSDNNRNNVLDIGIKTFGDDYKVSHIIKPAAGILDILDNIDITLGNFTNEDFCIILAGERDFEATNNYVRLIYDIREKLEKVTFTNIIFCLPCYKCGDRVDMYNGRVELFNNLLYQDNLEYTYMTCFDSNCDISYDGAMFLNSGRIKNNALRNIFRHLSDLLTKDYLSYNNTGCMTSDQVPITHTDNSTQTDARPLFHFQSINNDDPQIILSENIDLTDSNLERQTDMQNNQGKFFRV